MKPLFDITKDQINNMEDYGKVKILKDYEINEVVVETII